MVHLGYDKFVVPPATKMREVGYFGLGLRGDRRLET